jgi:hypothetical protein
MDLQSLLGLGSGNDPTGLLTPQQSGEVNQQTMQGIAAGLLKASGPSPYKGGMTALSGIGEALQGGLAQRRAAQDEVLKSNLVRAKTLESLKPFLELQTQYQQAGVPLPPQYQRLIDQLTGTVMGPGAMPSARGAAAAPPRAPAGAPAVGASAAGGEKPMSLEQFAAHQNYSPEARVPSHPEHATLMKDFSNYRTAIDQWGPQAAREAERAKNEETQTAQTSAAINALAARSAQGIQQGRIQKAAMSDPGYTSGMGAPFIEFLNQAKNLYGYNKSAATPNEVANAIASGELNDTANQTREALKGTTGFLPAFMQREIDNTLDKTKNLGNTEESSRVLNTIKDRMHERNLKIAELMNDYQATHNGALGPGFNAQMIKFFKDPANNLLSPEEEKNIRLLGRTGTEPPPATGAAPAAPGSTPAATPTYAPGTVRSRIKDGKKETQVLDANGQWVTK